MRRSRAVAKGEEGGDDSPMVVGTGVTMDYSAVDNPSLNVSCCSAGGGAAVDAEVLQQRSRAAAVSVPVELAVWVQVRNPNGRERVGDAFDLLALFGQTALFLQAGAGTREGRDGRRVVKIRRATKFENLICFGTSVII